MIELRELLPKMCTKPLIMIVSSFLYHQEVQQRSILMQLLVFLTRYVNEVVEE